MKCPKCGQEIPDDSTFCVQCGSPVTPPPSRPTVPTRPACPRCGAPLKPGAAFCSVCGAPVGGSGVTPPATAPTPAQAPAPAPRAPLPHDTAAWQPAGAADAGGAAAGGRDVRPEASEGAPKGTRRRRRGAAVAVAVVLVACAAGAGAWWVTTGGLGQVTTAVGNALGGKVSVPVHVVAPNYTYGATRIPLRVQGTSDAGDAVDETVYVDGDDASISVAPGTYQLTVVASPILEDGSLYELPADPVELVVPDSSKGQSDGGSSSGGSSDGGSSDAGSSDAGSSPTITLTPVSDASQVTDEQIEAARQAAAADPEDGGKSEALASAATMLRDDERNAVGNVGSNLASGGYATSDGTYDYFFATGGGGICRVAKGGTDVEKLASLDTNSVVKYLNVDGSYLFYVREPIYDTAKEGDSVFRLDVSSGEVTQIDKAGTFALEGLYEYGHKLYEVTLESGSGGSTYRVYSMEEDGSNKTQLAATSSEPFVTRDGIVYAINDTSSSYTVYYEGFDGTSSVVCTGSDGNVVGAPIVQDGTVYLSVQGKSMGCLYSVGLDGSNLQRLVEEQGSYGGVSVQTIADGAVYVLTGDGVTTNFKARRIEAGGSTSQEVALPQGFVIPRVQSAGDHLIVLGSNQQGQMISAAATDFVGGRQTTYVTGR